MNSEQHPPRCSHDVAEAQLCGSILPWCVCSWHWVRTSQGWGRKITILMVFKPATFQSTIWSADRCATVAYFAQGLLVLLSWWFSLSLCLFWVFAWGIFVSLTPIFLTLEINISRDWPTNSAFCLFRVFALGICVSLTTILSGKLIFHFQKFPERMESQPWPRLDQWLLWGEIVAFLCFVILHESLAGNWGHFTWARPARATRAALCIYWFGLVWLISLFLLLSFSIHVWSALIVNGTLNCIKLK